MSNTNIESYLGATAEDNDGDKIGKIGQVYLDDETQEPTWVTLHTGLFGSKETFAPLYGSNWDGSTLHLAVSKELVKDAPNLDADGHLDDDENQRLYTYYSGYLGGATQPVTTDAGLDDRADLTGQAGVQGHDTSGKTTDDAMTLSEERLLLITQHVES